MIVLKRAVIMMLLAVMTTVTAWAEQSGVWTYQRNADGQRCVITGYTGSTDVRSLTIPMQLDGLWVVSIYDNVLSACEDLEILVFYKDARIEYMPDVQKEIFEEVQLISDVEGKIPCCLPASITDISNAFRSSGILTLSLPGVTKMGNMAFQNCKHLSSVTFEKAATIGDRAFANLNSDCTVSYTGSMANWSWGNYQYSPKLVVYCSDGSRGWCGDAWSDGMELYRDASCLHWTLDSDGHLDIDCIVWDDFFENYGQKQIIKTNRWNASAVKTLTLSHVYDIDGRVINLDGSVVNGEFENYNYLTSVVVNEGLVRIGSRAFAGCQDLHSVSLPSSVTFIGSYAFANCSSLADIYFNGTGIQWADVTKVQLWNYKTPATMKIHWRCSVTFDANGHGTAPATQTNLWSNEDKAANPGVLSAEGYVFTGWYTDAACTTPWNFGTDIVQDDMTLYAGWAEPCAVTASANEASIDIPYGQEWTDIPVTLNSLTLGWFQNQGGSIFVADAVAVTPFVGSGAGSEITFFNTSGGDNFYAYRGAGEHEVGNRVTEAMTATGQSGNIWVYIPKETWKSAAPGDYLYRLPYDAVFYNNSVSPAESYNYSLGGDAQVTLWVTIPESSITTGVEQVQSSMFKVQSDEWYTIDGRKLFGKPTKKGVYIHNGKKAIVN